MVNMIEYIDLLFKTKVLLKMSKLFKGTLLKINIMIYKCFYI